ncbi:MAG: phytoene dehydrogenase [Planctomycetaceae bacterium]|nr:phytoene dehydrogenase [Planctomycetaceae bacterium]
MPYDTIIIGAGLSGLAAGIRLAHFDQSVCILERHYTIGGLNSFYRLRSRNHDVGLHAVTNYASAGSKTGPLSKLLRQLRLSWDDFSLCPQIESSVVFPGYRLRFNNQFDFFRQQVHNEFPAEKDRFEKLLTMIAGHNELHLTSQTASARQILADVIADPVLVDMLFCPLMFYGSPTKNDMDFSQFVIMFKAIFEQGFGRPMKGIRPLLKTLVNRYRKLGGELKLRSGVQKILTRGDRACGVVLDNAEVLEAHNVLSSAGSLETQRLCDDDSRATDPPITPGEISFVETIFSLDRLPADLGHSQTVVFFNGADRFDYRPPAAACDTRSGIICSPNNFVYPSDHVEEGRIRITALANPRFWFEQSPSQYESEKAHWREQILAAALPHMPDFRPHILDCDMFTPKTITKFTGHVNGAVYGSPDKIRDGRTHLKNLFLCGTDQGFVGIVGTLLSGITIANLHLLKP